MLYMSVYMGFLTEEERKAFRKRHSLERDLHLRDRIKVILALDKGYSYDEVAMIMLLDDTTIRRYEHSYKEGGIDRLLTLNYKDYVGKLSSPQIDELKQYLREHLMGSAKEIVAYIKERFDIEYTPEGMVDLLHRIGFSYKKTKQVPSKADISKQEEFIQKYEEIKKELKDGDKIYFLDAVHPQHNSMPMYAWIETGKDKEILTNTGRQRVNINGALDVQTQEVIFRLDDTINAQSTVDLLKQIEEKEQGAETIYAIMDNAKYNYSKIVKEYLEHSRIKVVFLPTYSPNLNLIERLWKFFKKKMMRGKYYVGFVDFKESVIKFFRDISIYKHELKSLLTENFQLIGTHL